MRWSISISLIVLFVARLVFEERIGNKLFAAGFLFILAFPFIAQFLMRTMGEQTKTPLLSLIRRTENGESSETSLLHDPKMNEWYVPVDLIIENKGKGEARNWRLWFSPQDDTTSVILGADVAQKKAYIRDTLTGRCETILDSRSRVQDLVIGPDQRLSLGDTSRIILRGEASSLEIRVALDADGMSSRSYIWELIVNKDAKRVLWKDCEVQNEQDE